MWKPIILDVECIVCNKTLQKIKHDPREASRKMGKITNRRARTPNWSLDEKQYLLKLIKEHKDIVVTKNNNGPNLSEEKDVVWNEILRKLTEKFGTKFSLFSVKKVKTQWQNMKRIAREDFNLNGASVQKYSRHSLEVCNILDLVADSHLKNENESIISANIEIKSESIDEDISPANCNDVTQTYPERSQVKSITSILESSESSVSGHPEIIDAEIIEETQDNTNKNKSSFTVNKTNFQDIPNILPLHKELQEFLKYTATEKHLKMETLKEERQVVRAMRETAELNKIIAEQKLKHILWIKKHEIADDDAIYLLRKTLIQKKRKLK